MHQATGKLCAGTQLASTQLDLKCSTVKKCNRRALYTLKCIGRWLCLGTAEECSMEIGKVKWFNNAKGYGFVVAEGRNEDLFAHYSAIQMDGYRTLKAGQPVQFEIIQGPKGLHAVNIQALGEPVRRSEAPASDLATAE